MAVSRSRSSIVVVTVHLRCFDVIGGQNPDHVVKLS
jgi:hypothetical protein